MNRAISMLIACAAIAATAGCGSSSSASPRSSSSATVTAGELKPIGTPKYVAPASSSPVRSGIVEVAYRNITISPDTIRVKLGSTIRWTNYDSVEHNVTSEGGPLKFASKDFGEGGTFEVKANRLGLTRYECTIHPASMNGTLEVVK